MTIRYMVGIFKPLEIGKQIKGNKIDSFEI